MKRLILTLCLGVTLSAQQQLIGTERIYWNPAPSPDVLSYAVLTTAQQITLGPCIQTPLSIDHAYACDAPLPVLFVAPGVRPLQLVAVYANGVSDPVPIPAIVLRGIGAPLPVPQNVAVIAGAPPPPQPTCTDPLALNVGGPLPCIYPPPPVSGNPALNTHWTTLAPIGCTVMERLLFLTDQEWFAACRTQGVNHTSDGGQTWAFLNSGLSGVNVVSVVASPYGPLAVSFNTGGGVFRWTGQTWTRGSLVAAQGVDTLPNGNLLAVSNSGGPFVSYLDTAGDLQFVSSGNTGITGIAGAGGLHHDDQSNFWVTSEGGGTKTARTANGVTWTADSNNLSVGGSGFGNTSGSTLLYFSKSSIARHVGPSDWRAALAPPFYLDQTFSTVRTSVALGQTYVGTAHQSHGVYVSTDDGDHWTPYLDVLPGPRKAATQTDQSSRLMGLGLLTDGAIIACQRDGLCWKAVP